VVDQIFLNIFFKDVSRGYQGIYLIHIFL